MINDFSPLNAPVWIFPMQLKNLFCFLYSAIYLVKKKPQEISIFFKYIIFQTFRYGKNLILYSHLYRLEIKDAEKDSVYIIIYRGDYCI